ncbi:hypothetical protein BGZ73_005142 [Actinomortierella ambigua]|nr:hypothetical protein BGZ73_005142 [Actinomortierella ambigua]
MGRRQSGNSSSSSSKGKPAAPAGRTAQRVRATRSSARSNGQHDGLNGSVDKGATNFELRDVKREDDLSDPEKLQTLDNSDDDDFVEDDRRYKRVEKSAKEPVEQDDITDQSMISAVGGDEEDEDEDEDEDDDDEDEENWEEVSVPVQHAKTEDGDEDDEDDQDEDGISGPWMYNAVEIVFDKPLQETKKPRNRGITKEERMIRVLLHQTHILCLIGNGQIRNRWINHEKLRATALSIVPDHIATSVQGPFVNAAKEVNTLQVLALWWKDSFVVTGPGIQNKEFLDPEVVGYDTVIPDVHEEDVIKRRKDLQRRLLNRHGNSDVCSQLFTAICRALGLKARLIESLQPCSFKISKAKEEGNEPSSSSQAGNKKRRKKNEPELEESDTTRGSRVVIPTPHRKHKRPPTRVPANHKQADPPVFWTEVYSTLAKKWICIDPVRGIVNSPSKLHPSPQCTTNVLSYVVAYDEDGYLMDVTRRYTRQWGSVTRKLRVQPAGPSGYDWWQHTLSLLRRPYATKEEEEEMAELLQSEVSEQIPTKIGDFNNHPLYALERHLKKFEVLHPKKPVLGHIRGEAIYPRSCVKHVRSKEQWLKRAREIKSDEQIPAKWVKARPATILQMRLQQQKALSGDGGGGGGGGRPRAGSRTASREGSPSSSMDLDDDLDPTAATVATADGDQVPLWGEWQTEPYKPPVVVDGIVPRNQYGRLDIFTPAMVPIGGVHLRGRNIAKIARQLGVDYVEAVTGFDFQSRRSVPVIDGIVVPAESSELVQDAFREVSHHVDQEARRKLRTEVLKRWRKFVMGVLVRARLQDEYGDPSAAMQSSALSMSSSVSKDGLFDPEKESKWEPKVVESNEDEESDEEVRSLKARTYTSQSRIDRKGKGRKVEEEDGGDDGEGGYAGVDSGAGFMLD